MRLKILTPKEDHNIQRRPDTDTGRVHPTLGAALSQFLSEGASDLESTTQSQQALREMISNFTLSADPNSDIAQNMMSLIGEQTEPQKGVPESFLDSLDRVLLSDLPDKDTADCPICTNRFCDDLHPLLVKLPCTSARNKNRRPGKDHIFDLECIGPWLKVNATCPLCRYNMSDHERLWREELAKLQESDDEEEEDGWDVYG